MSPSKSQSTMVFLSDRALTLYKMNGYVHSQQSIEPKSQSSSISNLIKIWIKRGSRGGMQW